MFCKICGTQIEEAKFCKNCGTKTEIENQEEIDLFEYSNNDTDVTKIPESEILKDDHNKVNNFKKMFKGIGIGGAVIGGGLIYLFFSVVRFLYIASAGLSMVWLAINLFQGGSIVWGLVFLIIGTPIAIGIASYLFLPLLIFSILTLIIWGVISIFVIHVSFGDIWYWLWFIIKIFLIVMMLYLWISEFIESIKKKQVSYFFKENWFYIPLFFLLFWLFFK